MSGGGEVDVVLMEVVGMIVVRCGDGEGLVGGGAWFTWRSIMGMISAAQR